MAISGSIIRRAINLRSKLKTRKKISPIKQQYNVLVALLKKSQNTAFGEYYNFSEILLKQYSEKELISEFCKRVPIHDYNLMFRNWWYRALNGESYVCWPGKVKYFALSSGTSEASSKYIPVTNTMLKAIKKTSIRVIFSLAYYDFPPEFYDKGILMLGGSTHLNFNGTYYEGDLSGITAGNIPFWFQYFYKPGRRISRERDWQTKLEEITENAKKWDIGAIVGVPAWIQILLEKIIDRYGLNNIHEIWPNLMVYTHGGVAFSPYKKGFEKLLGKPLKYIETYLASEGFIAYQSRPDTESMELVLDNGIFFEFVPFTEDNFDDNNNILPTAKTYTIDEIEENKEYAILLSTCSGAWRYLIGDTIKFTSKEYNEIIITGRTKHFLNLCGEHLSIENMDRAIQLTSEQLNIAIPEYAVTGIKYGTMFAHKWYIATDSNMSPEIIKEKIDSNLKILNDDYRVERLEAIKDVIVEVLKPEVFYLWMRSKGKEGGQNKFPRVLKKELRKEWEEFIKNNKI